MVESVDGSCFYVHPAVRVLYGYGGELPQKWYSYPMGKRRGVEKRRIMKYIDYV